jgi:calcineurin-like phosphoesterase family protein
MSTTFFTGCTHFDHENIIKLAGRPFSSVDEMNEELVRRWNAVVGADDVVYHLGDVGWSNHKLKHWLSRLNGRKIILLGNHDDGDWLKQAWDEPGTQVVGIRTHEMIRPSERVNGFHLYHYPIDDWNGRWKGSIHLHCHTHAKKLRNPSIPYVEEAFKVMDGDGDIEGVRDVLPPRYPAELKCNRFNVGVDATAFTPISLEEILAESLK